MVYAALEHNALSSASHVAPCLSTLSDGEHERVERVSNDHGPVKGYLAGSQSQPIKSAALQTHFQSFRLCLATRDLPHSGAYTPCRLVPWNFLDACF